MLINAFTELLIAYAKSPKYTLYCIGTEITKLMTTDIDFANFIAEKSNSSIYHHKQNNHIQYLIQLSSID
jgi:hypothetical protein